MKFSTFLPELINSGADAQRNLYRVTFTSNFDSRSEGFNSQKLTVRLENFIIPGVGASTVKLPYQNTFIEKSAPSHDIAKTTQFNIRLDNDYSVYNKLLSMLDVAPNGDYSDEARDWTITVESFKDGSVDELDVAEAWVFYHCRVLKVPNISFDYTGSGAIKLPITISYLKYQPLQATTIR